ncbi:hypothetical protein [Salinimicrobium oceani]|uniref:Uncharacterized protein n=1 Tax=Salinimicrobium oceani TaxID=2722702 RepID=A0ABX1CXS7_9FLAO|nr:hypothetical protein [Salinimicrobium oceani]NJW53075.1 hypothetical protein [Salinimicrobium oceani]
MKKLGFLLFLLFLGSCSVIEQNHETPFFSPDFEKKALEEEFQLIDADRLESFSELRNQIGQLACEGKVSGLKFTYLHKRYYVTAVAACPQPTSTACHFQRIQIYVKNDSVIEPHSVDEGKPLAQLAAVLSEYISKPYFLQTKENIMEPALIHLYVEEENDMEVTKKALATIAEDFAQLNSGKAKDFFAHSILLARHDPTNFPPPPPPAKN